MKFDIFLSICQTEVDNYKPTEKVMFQNFFSQLQLADELDLETAWVAETHLSCQTQKDNPSAVIPYFTGEIGLNTDILQLAHVAFAKTKRINIGSAIRNIICNGGPIAHAEAVRTFLTLHDLNENENRKLDLGFAAGRFPFSNRPYGYYPKTELEKAGWDVIKNKYFIQAVEIFLRLLKGEHLSSRDLRTFYLEKSDFRDPSQFDKIVGIAGPQGRVHEMTGPSGAQGSTTGAGRQRVALESHWNFEKVGVIPFENSLKNLRLTLGSHDPEAQILANEILPCGVFNLSITPEKIIEETHARMAGAYHADGGPWRRDLMPRTAMVFLSDESSKTDKENSAIAKKQAEVAWVNYWKAMEGTLDPKKVEQAVGNTIAGNIYEVKELVQKKYHKDDRLMLWFDFNNHNNEGIKKSMRSFFEKVV